MGSTLYGAMQIVATRGEGVCTCAGMCTCVHVRSSRGEGLGIETTARHTHNAVARVEMPWVRVNLAW